MSADVAAITCSQCGKQVMNEPMLNNHIFLNHELPKLFKEGDETLNKLRKAYAYHMVRGQCEKHGPADCVCIHPNMEALEGELELFCYPCLVANYRARAE